METEGGVECTVLHFTAFWMIVILQRLIGGRFYRRLRRPESTVLVTIAIECIEVEHIVSQSESNESKPT